MDEREACALLKQRFEAAGFSIEENRPLEVDGRQFEVDGYDASRAVGYEYVTSESGDGWDVDDDVIAALAAHRAQGDLHILVVDEGAARDAKALGKAADAFLAELKRTPPPVVDAKPAKKPAKAAPTKPEKPEKPDKKPAKPAAKAAPAKPKAKKR